jgi:hypothetical protein
MAFESTQSFKPQITGDPSNRSYSVKVLDDGTTIITQQEITGGRTATQVMGRIAKKGTFIPEKIGSQTLPNTDQIKYFTENSTDIVKNYSIPTVLTGIGGSAGGGYAKVNEILGTNFSPPTPTPGSGTELKLDAKDVDPLNEGIKSRSNSIKNHGDYRYPFEMPNNMDKIKFNMYTYGIRKTNLNFVGFSTQREPGELKGSVTLGIQPRISDTNSVSWNDLGANAIELALAGASQDLATAGASAISGVVDKIVGTYKAENSNIQAYARTALAGAAAGISGLTSRIGGVILNPNLELLFDSPQLRPFDFTFQLTPRDRDEAKQVKQIIRFFKQGMAVQRTETQLFLKAPNIFDIKYLFGQKEDHPGLNKIKRCALVSCSVDYTPTGSYMTFSDGTMTAYNITLSFKELEPVYSDEYQDPTDNETVESVQIGF